MAERLSENGIENIATNYEYLYGIYTIHEELKALFRSKGDNKFFIFKFLCVKLGRLLGEGCGYFRTELNYDQNRKLIEDIERKYIIKVIERKRYTQNGDLCIVFLVYR